jgi:hypothetical protein
MLSDGRGAVRGDPLAAVRDVTEWWGEKFTIATALFVPQNDEVEMERSLLLRGVILLDRAPCVRLCVFIYLSLYIHLSICLSTNLSTYPSSN